MDFFFSNSPLFFSSLNFLLSLACFGLLVTSCDLYVFHFRYIRLLVHSLLIPFVLQLT